MKKLLSVLLTLALLAALALPVSAAGSVTWTRDTSLSNMRNIYDDATVAAGVTLTMQNWRPDPQGLEIGKSLTVEPGGAVTGGSIIFARGATCAGLPLYYIVAGAETPLTVSLAELTAVFPQSDYQPTFWFEPETGHYVLHGNSFDSDPFAPPAANGGSGGQSTEEIAAALKSLGLFQGTDTGFDLDRAPTRLEEVILLIRLLGKETEALSRDWEHPFTDVPSWGTDTRPQKYVGFAYQQTPRLANGVSNTEFGTGINATAQMFATFLLRALGYNDIAAQGAQDFTYEGAVAFATEKGLIAGAADVTDFNRGTCVRMMEAALRQNRKGGNLLWRELAAEGVFTEAAYEAAFIRGDGGTTACGETEEPAAPPVSCERQSVDTADGAVNAWVLRVNTADPRVTVRSAMVDDRLGATAAFTDIVAAAGDPWAVINGNFFEAYQPFQVPIGHVMTGGKLRYSLSGLSSFGIDASGGLHMGRLPIFTRIQATDGTQWTAYEVNTAGGQLEGSCVLFTPSYGAALDVKLGAYVLTAENGAVTGYRWADAGEQIPIPANGWLLYLTKSYAEQPWIHAPKLGTAVSEPEPYLFNPTADSFEPKDMVSILSGSPRLVQGGAICYDLDGGFDDPTRFGPKAAAGRTAVGIDKDGLLVLVSVDAATVQQMRELMWNLGCVEALNLDGGASRALYCDGTYLCRPGRLLTTTLQVFYRE